MTLEAQKNKEKIQRERFEIMAVRLARHLSLSNVDEFELLPVSVKSTLNRLQYFEIVMPLIENDRDKFGLSLRQLENKYGLKKSTIHYHLNRPEKKTVQPT